MSIDILRKRELGTNIIPPVVRLVSEKESKDKADELSGSKGKGTLMMMGTGFFIFFPVIPSEDGVIFSGEISGFCEIIPKVLIGRGRHSSILSLKRAGLFFWPDITCEFSQLVMGGKLSDIAYLRDNTCSQNIINSRDSSKSLGERREFGGYSAIKFFKEGFKGADGIDLMREDEVKGAGEFGAEAIRFTYSSFDKVSYVRGASESIFAFPDDEVCKLREWCRDKLFLREGREDGRDSLASEWGEGFILEDTRSLKEDIGEEDVSFPDNAFNQMEAVTGKEPERLIGVRGYMRKRESRGDTEVLSQDFSIDLIGFAQFRERFTETVYSQSIESKNFDFTGKFCLSEEISQMPVIDTGRFGSKFDRGYLLSGKNSFLKKLKEFTTTLRCIGEREGRNDFISFLIHNTGNNFLHVHVQANRERSHYFTSFPREAGNKEGESWLPGYRAASRISTQVVRCSVSSSYPGPGGQTFTSTLRCLEVKSIPELPPSEVIITRILPISQYRDWFSLS